MKTITFAFAGFALFSKIVRNDDGTYDRVTTEGGVRLKWSSVVNGKDF